MFLFPLFQVCGCEAWFEESFVVPGEKFVQWRVLGFLKWEHSPSVGSRGTGRMGGRVQHRAANDPSVSQSWRRPLDRHYAKQALTPGDFDVKLGPLCNYLKGRAALRHYANQPARPL